MKRNKGLSSNQKSITNYFVSNKVNGELKYCTNQQTKKTKSPVKLNTKALKSPLKANHNIQNVKLNSDLASPLKSDLPINGSSNIVFQLKSPLKRKREGSHANCNKKENLESSKVDTNILDNDLSIFNFIEWEEEAIITESLQLDESRRCKIISLSKMENGDISLFLECLENSLKGSCVVTAPWNSLQLEVGNIVSAYGKFIHNRWIIARDGYLVHHSDILITGTGVVGSLFCMRRAVLNYILKNNTSGDTSHMIIGIVVHELLQEVLRNKIKDFNEIEKLYQNIITSDTFVRQIYSENLNYDDIVQKIEQFLINIQDFVNKYVSPININKSYDNYSWDGEITAINDIEENIWTPSLGIKGKIDATIEVKVNYKKKIMPLEIKTGKSSFSVEHRGQVILYCMMLSHCGYSVDSGLLLYLKDGQIKEIKAGESERRDLLMLRNQLAQWLAKCLKPKFDDNDNWFSNLPPPINHHSACSNCPFLTCCSSALKKTGIASLIESNPLKKISVAATDHLSMESIDYIFHWISLLFLEKDIKLDNSSSMWSSTPDIREMNGFCVTNLQIAHIDPIQDGRYLHKFVKSDLNSLSNSIANILDNGQYVIVSNENQIAIATGIVQIVSDKEVTIFLDRNLNKFSPPFHVDRCSSNSEIANLAGNLGLLLENSNKSNQLRNIIINMKLPQFSKKLSSRIKRVGMKIFQFLNQEQERVVLQSLTAQEYILIKGMPGTGKTSTVCGLIELLVNLNCDVLVCSHTHSAIDNIFRKLNNTNKDFNSVMLRIGPELKIHPELRHISENFLIKQKKLKTMEEIDEFYLTKKIVGVTCLGAYHFLLSKKEFDVCIVDEATQVSLPEIIRSIYSAKKFILIGDPEQLPPLVKSDEARKLGMSESLFSRLDRPAVRTELWLQYRMNGYINSIANQFTYNGKLKCANEQIENSSLNYTDTDLADKWPLWLKKTLSKQIEDSIVLVNVQNLNVKKSLEEKTIINEAEGNIISDILKALEEVNIDVNNSVGIMASYCSQVSYLKKLFVNYKNLEINTVDQYQGRDKEIILYSTARFNRINDKINCQRGILNDKNRLTVALTRAKFKFIIIGDLNVLNKFPTFNSLIKLINPNNIVHP